MEFDDVTPSAPSVTGALARTIQCIATEAGDHATALPELTLHRRNAPTDPLHCIFPLGLAFTAQGHKEVQLGGKTFAYGPGQSMLTTMDLPVAAHVTRATSREPYLAVLLRLDVQSITRGMSEVELPRPDTRAARDPISVKRLDAPVVHALLRLVHLLDRPRLLRPLAPLIRQEIVVRLLIGPHASHLSHLVTAAAPTQQIAKAVAWMKQHVAETVSVETLAERANMSASTFRQHFRTLTGMSPVQFQKRLRLQEARQLMLNQHVSAAGASALVGYESASQFSREYRRLFGAPPQKDVRQTLAQ